MRERLVRERTAIVNQVRGLLMEYGIVIAQGVTQVRKKLTCIIEDTENKLSSLVRSCDQRYHGHVHAALSLHHHKFRNGRAKKSLYMFNQTIAF